MNLNFIPKKYKNLSIYTAVFAIIGLVLILFTQAAPVPLDSNFKHPGILLDQNQLDFIKNKVNNNEEPWKSAYEQLASISASNYTYTASPVSELKCSSSVGINEGFEQAGCSAFNSDSAAVYTQSLRYIITGDDRYAQSAINIMNQWADTLSYIPYDFPGDPDTANGWPAYWQNKLLVGWSAESMLRGAEILRYNYSGWEQAEIENFEAMLNDLYMPVLMSDRTGNGNGGVTWAEAVVNIGIFLDDQDIYDEGIRMWEQRSSALIYLNRDGSQPAYPINLETGQNTYGTSEYIRQLWRVTPGSSFIEGQEQETCRDMGHTMMGLGAMANTAETARIQGRNLYDESDYKERLMKGLELNSDYINQMIDRMNSSGQTISQVGNSSWVPNGWPNCNDFKDGGSSAYLGTEIAYNHYVNRMGESMPNTKKLAESVRPQKSYGNHMLWETLTHAETGTLTTPPPDPTCEDPAANNTGGPLPCTYDPPPPDGADFTWSGITEGQVVSGSLPVETIPTNASVVQFDYYIDEQFSKTDKFAPHCLASTNTATCQSYDFSFLDSGNHTLKAVMTYDIDKTLEKTIYFSIPSSSSNTSDINQDGTVGIVDLSILLNNWDPTGSGHDDARADIDNDNNVGIIDLSIMLNNWGQ